MKRSVRITLIILTMALVVIHTPDALFSEQSLLSEESSLHNLKSVRLHFETPIDES
jgi:hypothetical protein